MDSPKSPCDSVYEAINLIKSEQIDEEVIPMNLSDDMIELKPVVGLQTSTPCEENNSPGNHYDDVFDSVIAKSIAGTLTTEPKSSLKKMNPAEAANSFLQLNENKSPTSTEGVNEVTPYTSPQDEAQNFSKFLQKPKKTKADQSRENTFHKQKVLGYKDHKRSGEKHSRKKHLRELNSDKKEKKKMPLKQKVLTKGVWVQCCIRSCLKWRFLQNCIDPSVIPEFWSCSMNEDDLDQNKCTTPEIDWMECISSSQDHFVYSDYNEGSIVWAKMPGYPYWPAMVESDPDFQMFYEYDEDGVVLRYHVVFLDENVSRAWISARSIEPYSDDNLDKTQIIGMAGHFKKALSEAVTTADCAYKLPLAKRLEMYNFDCRFTKETHSSVWNGRKHRSKKPRSKTQHRREEGSQQIVPEVEFSQKETLEEVEETFTAELESCKIDPDYWQNADDADSVDDEKEEVIEIVEEKKEKKREKTVHKDQIKPQIKKTKQSEKPKQPIVSKPKFTKTSENTKAVSDNPKPTSAAKPKFKPSFNAPVKPSFSVKKRKIVSSPPSAVVPSMATEKNKSVLKSSENITKGMDEPFVSASQFTPSVERKDEDSNSPIEERRNQLLTDTMQCEVGSECADKAINLSLQSTENLENNGNISGSDFWLNADCKNKKENPFPELEMEIEENEKVTVQWTEEKLKELDEHMPPITDF